MPETAIHVPVCMIDPRRGFLRGAIVVHHEDDLYEIAWEGGLGHEIMSPAEAQEKLLDPIRLGKDGILELLTLRDEVGRREERITALLATAALALPER